MGEKENGKWKISAVDGRKLVRKIQGRFEEKFEENSQKILRIFLRKF